MNKWAEAVGLTAEEILAFRYLTKKEMSTEICIHSLSKLFGVKLFYNSYEAMAKGESHRKELRKLELKNAGEGFQEKDIVAVYKYEKNPSFGKAYWSAYQGIPIPIQDGGVDISLQIMWEHYDILCDIRFFDQNLKKIKIKAGMTELGTANRLFIHQNAKGEDFLYAVCGKYIYRFDLDMNLLSSHHLRGDIRYICLGKRMFV